MLSTKQSSVLEQIYEELNKNKVNWVLTGGSSFILRGIPLETSDIDIQTDRDGAYKFQQLFKKNCKQPVNFSGMERIRSHFGVFDFDGVKVEVIGDIEKYISNTWDKPPSLHTLKEFLDYNNMSIPVLPLDYEIEAYNKIGRVEKASFLTKWLDKQP